MQAASCQRLTIVETMQPSTSIARMSQLFGHCIRTLARIHSLAALIMAVRSFQFAQFVSTKSSQNHVSPRLQNLHVGPKQRGHRAKSVRHSLLIFAPCFFNTGWCKRTICSVSRHVALPVRRTSMQSPLSVSGCLLWNLRAQRGKRYKWSPPASILESFR